MLREGRKKGLRCDIPQIQCDNPVSVDGFDSL